MALKSDEPATMYAELVEGEDYWSMWRWVQLHEQPMTEIEVLVSKYGEEYRSLITDVFRFLDEHEASWGVKLKRSGVVHELIRQQEDIIYGNSAL